MKKRYKVLIMYDPEYKGYIVDAPELRGCMSQGKTMDEALENIRDAIKGWLKVEKKKKNGGESIFTEVFIGEVAV